MSPSATAMVSPKAVDETFLPALQEAYRATMLHVLPQAQARGLAGKCFWSLYWLGQGMWSHPSELAHRLGITAPACTAIVDQLVEQGLVQRRTSQEDRRQVVLVMTPKGHRTIDAVWSAVAQRIHSATRSISPSDLAVTARVLGTVAQHLDAQEKDR